MRSSGAPIESTSANGSYGTNTHTNGHGQIDSKSPPDLAAKPLKWQVPTLGKIYMTLVVIETLGLYGVAIASLATSSDQSNDVRYIAVVCLLATTGFLYFAIDSILHENIFQFWASVGAHGFITCYVIWHEYSDTLGSLYKSISLGFTIAVICFQAIYLCLSPFVYKTFGWRLYKKVGGNLAIRSMYKTRHIFVSLLKMDCFIGTLLVLLASFFLFSDYIELFLNIAAMSTTIGWACLGYYSVKHESLYGMYVFALFVPVEPTYIAIKLWDMQRPDRDTEYPHTTYKQFFITGSIAIIIRVLLCIWAFFAKRNFGLGLLNKVYQRQVARHVPSHSQSQSHSHSRSISSSIIPSRSSPVDPNYDTLSASGKPSSLQQPFLTQDDTDSDDDATTQNIGVGDTNEPLDPRTVSVL